MMSTMQTNLLLLFYAATSSIALILVKLGSKTEAPASIQNGKLHFNLSAYILGGIFLYGISFLMYIYLISKNDLGYVIPLATALVYTFIFVASFFIFKETFTAVKIIGICFVLAGIVLLNIAK